VTFKTVASEATSAAMANEQPKAKMAAANNEVRDVFIAQ
jgi:hypothetical protein